MIESEFGGQRCKGTSQQRLWVGVLPGTYDRISINSFRDFIRSAVTMATIVLLLSGNVQPARLLADDGLKPDLQVAKENGDLRYRCHVVDKETGQAIPNARIDVRLTTFEPEGYRVHDEAKYVSDAGGRYEIVVPSKLVEIDSLAVERNIDHDDYAAMRGLRLPLRSIRDSEQSTARSVLEIAELLPGEAVTGTVVSPEGLPLAGVIIKGFSIPVGGRPSYNHCLTNAEGRFRLNLHKQGEAALWIIPKNFASVEKLLSKRRGELGEFKLTQGVRVKGLVLGIDGKPLSAVAVQIEHSSALMVGQARISGNISRATVTDAEGRFECDPLPVGEYTIKPSEEIRDPVNSDIKTYEISDVFFQQTISIKDDAETQSITLKAVPHVIISGLLLDSSGKRRPGARFSIGGQVDRNFWNTSRRTDSDGAFSVWVPHGLQNTRIQFASDQKQTWRYRRGKDQPLKNQTRFGALLGTMMDDFDDFEAVIYKSPVVVVSAVDEEHKPIPQWQVTAIYPWGNQSTMLKTGLRSDLRFEDLPDGRTRTEQMIPDEDVTFKLTAQGFEPASKTVKLAEGETQELFVTMKKVASEDSKGEVESEKQ